MCRRHVTKIFYFDSDDENLEDDIDDNEMKNKNNLYMLKGQEYPRTGAHKGASPIYFYYPEAD